MGNANASVNVNDKLLSEIVAVDVFISAISEKYNISSEDVINLLKENKKTEKKIQIPTCIFRNRKLGVLESLVKYLREELKLNYHDIGIMLNRDERVIWVSYTKAVKKVKSRFTITKPNYWVYASIFAERRLGVLEILTKHMKEELHLGYTEIAFILNRSAKTIWSSYNQSKKKNG